jgi:hypothetical protein
MTQAFSSFGEDLVRVPIGSKHDGRNCGDVLVRDRVLEEVTHAVHEHCFWCWPLEWIEEFVRYQTWREPMFVGVTWNASKAFSERFGVTVLTAGTDLEASADRVPRRLGPLDLGMLTQNAQPR